MTQLQLPHKTADYLCPINGLADIYHWKTGDRIPDQLLFYTRSGFLLITNKKAISPKMIFLSISSIGKKQYEFWSGMMGYHLYTGEGGTFRNTLKKIRDLIDRDIPVIIFGLDMFHLSYQEKFYHNLHVPGHVVLMTGYDDASVFVQDNSKTETQRISLTDLELAWGSSYLDISRKNAYFGIDFICKERDSREILRNAFADMANSFLNSPVNFMGKRGIEKLISEFPRGIKITIMIHWNRFPAFLLCLQEAFFLSSRRSWMKAINQNWKIPSGVRGTDLRMRWKSIGWNSEARNG